MKRTLQILNILSVLFALVMNFLVGSQTINVPSIGSVSDKYATLLTPATYAFAIWSLIYLLIVILAVYQARDFFRPNKENVLPQKLGPYFIIANIGNALWTYVFVSDYIGLSVAILLTMVISLFMVLSRLRIALYEAPARTIAFVWWPLMMYAGWVLVASVVNIASWLVSLGVALSTAAAAVVLVALCNLLIILLFTRNVRELVLASTWGIAAIAVQLYQIGGEMVALIVSITVSVILLICVAAHAYMNRHATIVSQLF